MANFWMNFAIEIAVLSFLGVLYYFYQKRKLVEYEENKTPLVMSFILQSCLAHKTDAPDPKLDTLIESLDDFLQNKSSAPPLALLRTFAASQDCGPELKEIIDEGLKELES
jgi:hypothetical protein